MTPDQIHIEGLLAAVRSLSMILVQTNVIDYDVIKGTSDNVTEIIMKRETPDDQNRVVAMVMQFCLGTCDEQPPTSLTVIDGGKS